MKAPLSRRRVEAGIGERQTARQGKKGIELRKQCLHQCGGQHATAHRDEQVIVEMLAQPPQRGADSGQSEVKAQRGAARVTFCSIRRASSAVSRFRSRPWKRTRRPLRLFLENCHGAGEAG